MKLSCGFWQTFKEVPNDAEITSHQLLIRAGLIQKANAGLYNYLPAGYRVIRKVENIVREEMDKAGCLELLMPVVTPGELWQESGRWDKMEGLMLKFKDRGGRDLCISPTNEESITDVFRKTVKSYKQLPVTLYQINTKFRDEIRPRYGLMRAREFIMKDAYSFHSDKASLDEIYDRLFKAYENVFKRIGLEFIAVEADGGAMADGDAKTHEFQVVAENGEDEVIYCPKSGYAANREKAQTKRKATDFIKTDAPIEAVDTPNAKTIEEVASFLKIAPHHTLKSVLYTAIWGEGEKAKEKHFLILLVGDDSLNEIKLKNHVKADFLLPTQEHIIKDMGLVPGFVGAYNAPKDLHIIYDAAIDLNAAYVTGAELDKHYINFVPNRDAKAENVVDLRLAQAGDLDQKTGEEVIIKKGIEVGHIFQLGNKYTKALECTVLGQDGRPMNPLMGCYGIGVTRIVSAAIEQCNDENGIIWPKAIAPYQVHFLTITKKGAIDEFAGGMYQEIVDAKLETIYDDRDLGPGFKFKDADLLGIPVQVVLGERDYAKDEMIEVKSRKTGERVRVKREDLISTIQNFLEKAQ